MAIYDINHLRDKINGKKRLLGLDIGTKTIGLALSDLSWTIATPLRTIKRSKFSQDILILKSIIDEYEVYGLILGLPKNMDGSEGVRCQSIRQFAANVLEKINISIYFWDERLSTVAVTRTLIEADISRKRRQEVVDKMAAGYILQGVLDALPKREWKANELTHSE